jgi:hypothetical protein
MIRSGNSCWVWRNWVVAETIAVGAALLNLI